MRDLIALGALVAMLLAPLAVAYLPDTKYTNYIVLGIVSAAFITGCILSI